jgi:Flp pilus assembly protein TadG
MKKLRWASCGESGQILVMATLMLPVLLGFLALAVDIGYAYDYRRQLQTAADAAARAGGIAVYANSAISQTALESVVRNDAGQNGFLHGTNNITVSVCRPGVDLGCTATYTYSASDAAVKVTISKPNPTFFAQVLGGMTSLTLGVQAVASKGPGGTTSMILLGSTSGACTNSTLLSQSGGSQLNLVDDVIVDSCSGTTFANLSGGSTLTSTSGSIEVSSSGTPTCSGCSPAPTQTSYQSDPFASLAVPPIDTTCTGGAHSSLLNITSTVTLSEGTYCGGIMIQSGGNVTMNPGTYIMYGGGFQVKGGATAHGDGVMIYNACNGVCSPTNDQIHIQNATTLNGGVTLQITAPTTGTYTGIGLFQQRDNPAPIKLDGSAVIDISGVIYGQSAAFNFTGGSTSGALALYTIIVTASASFSGGSLLVSNDFSSIGGNPIGAISIAE